MSVRLLVGTAIAWVGGMIFFFGSRVATGKGPRKSIPIMKAMVEWHEAQQDRG